MANETSDQTGALGTDTGSQPGQSQAQDAAPPNNPATTTNPPPSRHSEESPNLSQQRTRGQSFSRFSDRLRAVRSGAGGLDRSTSNVGTRPTRRGTDLAEDVVDHPARSSISTSSRFEGGRSNTVSARSKIPNPGELRRSETRAREEEWARTVAFPPAVDPPRTSREGNADRVGELPSFGRTNSNNVGEELGSLRRRPTAVTTGRPRGDSVRSRISITPQTRPGEQGPDPTFSLAGPGDPTAAALPFVERGYAVLNPAYEQPLNARPVWGLAKPLPRVVRPGMVPSQSELDVNKEPDLEAGEARKKKARGAWDLALAAARAKKLKPQDEEDEGDGEIQTGQPSSISQGTAPTEISGMPPPIPEHPDEEESLEPFPNADAGSSATEVLDEDGEYSPDDMLALKYLDEIHNHHTQWSVIRTRYREPLAELLAVIVQLTLGFCADLAVTASSSPSGDTTAWAWGLATMIGIYIAGGISGAHLNPAISIMLWIYRGFPLRKVPSYVFAQVLGGFIAALISFGIYRDVIINYGGRDLANGGTAGDIVTYPRYEWISIPTAFFNEFVGTSFLAVAVMALGDDSNAPPGAGMNAFILGLIVTVISMAFGHNTGAACNPSRDFGPRLALLALGYGNSLFTDPYWFYGPWVATITGAIFGAFLYDLMIFVGGESPVNYPSYKMKRAAKKWRGRMRERVGRVPARLRGRRYKRSYGYRETDGK